MILDLIKSKDVYYIKDVYQIKDTFKRLKDKAQAGRKYLQNVYKQNDIVYLITEALNIVKTSIFPNLMYRVNVIPIKTPHKDILQILYFVDIDKLILKFI